MSRRFLMLLALLAVAGGVGWLIYPVAPLYKGKPLTHWLRGYDDWPGVYALGDATGPTRSDADAAVRHAGTNAIPALLRLLQARDSALKLKVLRWWDSMH